MAKAGKKEHEPTQEQIAKVKEYASLGINEKRIAKAIGIHHETLRKHYGEFMEKERAKVGAQVAQSLVDQALDGNVAAAMFYLKCNHGFKESHNKDIYELKKREVELKERQYEELKQAGGGLDILVEALQSARKKIDN